MRRAWAVALVLLGVATATLGARQWGERLQQHATLQTQNYTLSAVCDRGNGTMVYISQQWNGNGSAMAMGMALQPGGCKKFKAEEEGR